MTCKCHVDESTTGRYDLIIVRYLLTALGLDLKFSENIVIVSEGPCEGLLAPMVDISNYDFKYLTYKIVKS